MFDSTIPMPERVARLPRDKRGFPIPAGNIILRNGTPDFATLDQTKWMQLLVLRGCGICGEKMEEAVWFVGGPLCETNRLFFDHPMHEECATYALQICPYLAIPNFQHRKKLLDESSGFKSQAVAAASVGKPGRFMLGKTSWYGAVRYQGETLLHAGPWESITWWAEGKIMKGETNETQNQ